MEPVFSLSPWERASGRIAAWFARRRYACTGLRAGCSPSPRGRGHQAASPPDSPGGAALARAYGLGVLPLPVGEGLGEGIRPHRRL